MPCNIDFLDMGCFDPPDFDLFTDHLCLFPPALIFVLVRVLRIEFLDVQVLSIGDCIGDTPGDMLVVSYDYTRSARETGSNDINISSYQVTLVPDRWSGLSQMWIVAQNRRTCGGHSAIDNPIVACPQRTEAAKLFELFVLLQHAQV